MKWRKASDWHLESEDKHYSVAKCNIAGTSVYQAIRKPGVSLLVAASANRCKQACEADNAKW